MQLVHSITLISLHALWATALVCNTGWSPLNGYCYRMDETENGGFSGTSWNDAFKYCDKLHNGAYPLAEKKPEVLKTILERVNPVLRPAFVYLGISGFENALGSWIDGNETVAIRRCTKSDTLVPNVHGAKCGLVVYPSDYSDNYCISFQPCNKVQTFYGSISYTLCQYLAPSVVCPEGWLLGPDGSSCYKIVHQIWSTWDTEYCTAYMMNHEKPAELLILKDIRELAWIKERLEGIVTLGVGARIGLTSLGSDDGRFHWVDGTLIQDYWLSIGGLNGDCATLVVGDLGPEYSMRVAISKSSCLTESSQPTVFVMRKRQNPWVSVSIGGGVGHEMIGTAPEVCQRFQQCLNYVMQEHPGIPTVQFYCPNKLLNTTATQMSTTGRSTIRTSSTTAIKTTNTATTTQVPFTTSSTTTTTSSTTTTTTTTPARSTSTTTVPTTVTYSPISSISISLEEFHWSSKICTDSFACDYIYMDLCLGPHQRADTVCSVTEHLLWKYCISSTCAPYKFVSGPDEKSVPLDISSSWTNPETFTFDLSQISLSMWVFGYGSLVWYTNFPYIDKVPGTVKGYVRRFWQASPDHRGTHEKPGRTVTLVPDEKGEVFGVAYLIPEHKVEEVKKYLNWREKAGYIMQSVEFIPNDTKAQSFHLHVFVSDFNNSPFYTGGEHIETIADQVVECHGESGSNIEYVLRLAHHSRLLNPELHDEHLHLLEQAVLLRCRQKNITDPVLLELKLN